MARTIGEYSDSELKTLIQNHEARGVMDSPRYIEATDEWHRRHAGRLRLDTSIAHLRNAAREGKFVTYGELAEANGCTWNEVRYPMNDHLWVLVRHAKANGWPMLSAMIVNKEGKADGSMEASTLKGFITAARALKFDVMDEERFLKEQQADCHSWGRGEWPPSAA